MLTEHVNTLSAGSGLLHRHLQSSTGGAELQTSEATEAENTTQVNGKTEAGPGGSLRRQRRRSRASPAVNSVGQA